MVMGNNRAISSALRMAGGGPATNSAPWYTRSEARNTIGGLHSPVAGRTDHLPINVPAGAYVLPADVVSGLGQGNTHNGMQVLNKMFFQSGPLGMPPMKGGRGSGPPKASASKRKFAEGGDVSLVPGGEGDQSVPIMAAGGEFILTPEKVTEIGNGDMDLGHEVMDAFVKHVRDETIKTLKTLPGPAKD